MTAENIEILNFQNIEIANARTLEKISQCFSQNTQDHLSIVIIRNPYDYFDFLMYDLVSKKKSILFTQDIVNQMKRKKKREFLVWFKGLNFFPFYSPQVSYLDIKKSLPEALDYLECFDYAIPYEEIDLFLKNVPLNINITKHKEKKLIFSLGELKEEAGIFVEKDLALYDKTMELWREIKNNNFRPLASTREKRENLLNKEQVKDRYKGIVGRITSHSIVGWAMKKDEMECVAIAIYKNGELLHRAKADQLRKDIKERNIHPTGKCGFHITFDHPAFASGDQIIVKIMPDNVTLDMGSNALSFLDPKK